MQRYFVTPPQLQGGTFAITGDDARHIVKVMRMKPDDKIYVSDGQSNSGIAVIREITADTVLVELEKLLESSSEPAWSVTIAQSLPKGDKMELVIQKGTEIGACAFAPFQSERMIVQYDARKEAKRLERWGKIAKEAAEQCHRDRIPAIEGVRSWKELLQLIGSFDLALFCYEEEGKEHEGLGLRAAVQHWLTAGVRQGDKPSILLIAGPEGGFTGREAAEAEQAGARLVGLGRRILRAETAGIVGLTCLMYESGEMGGV
ncbi:16S rRNA (uracil(1498)-N(3))-methyltransferase [Paenibacillus sp. J5C_2022]|uniref:RsmE family RNA methyltransferase n=1 Tax=Paenibacillus sp. J5C2022 TaxID=2977129 RepID=UPI0021D30392|nr:RsmE family RNA methyltransferase [Paenibacillus sp. J5C2022]MCU6707659.1 16S rRNA (uracil(1498)-N(3))-methyltransferase [Paenibacillus sp. J5C2022]